MAPVIGRAQDVAASTVLAPKRLTKADSTQALESYWMARRHAAGVAMATGGGLLLIGGVTTLATPNEGATVLRSGASCWRGQGQCCCP